MNNYYDILGVSKDSTAEEIKKVYRKLSKEHHPDRGGDENRFKEISEAYTILGDSQKRAQYDNSLNNPFSGGSFDPNDLFNNFFNQGRQRQRQQSGEDLSITIQVSLEEIHTGGTKKIRYQRRIIDKRQRPLVCTTCNGTGTVSLMGPFRTKCSSCNGKGRIYATQTVNQNLSFDIPRGVNNGEKIFYAGFGNETLSGPGNLFVNITQKPHPIFTREGNNLLITKEIPFPILIIGGEMKVQTLTGMIKVKISENTKPMDRLRIAGKGLNYENGVGDLIIILKPITPTKINDEEKSLLEKLKESENFNNIK